jgi:hypothetical protein
MTDMVQALTFRALLGVEPGEDELRHIVAPAGQDADAYRASLRSRIAEVAQHRAAGDDAGARTAATEVVEGHQLAVWADPPQSGAEAFADFLGGLNV